MCIAVSIHDTVYRSEVNFGVVIFFGILVTIEGDYPEISHPIFFLLKGKTWESIPERFRPLRAFTWHGVPSVWSLLSLVALESLTAAEHGEPAHRCHSHWASHCMAPFWFKAFSVFPDSKVDTIYVLRKLGNLDLAILFGDAISNHGLHFGFGHLGHMDVSLGCGFSRCRECQLPYSW